jgi:hypothetical protein
MRDLRTIKLLGFSRMRVLYFISILLLSGCSVFENFPQSSEQYGIIEHENPFENFIDIEGDIAESLSFVVKVEYVATSTSKKCKNYNWMAGLYIPQSKHYRYYPLIQNSTHKVKLRLMEIMPGYVCNWLPQTVHLCVFEKGGGPQLCNSLFWLRGKHDGNSVVNLKCSSAGLCSRSPFGLHTEHINILNKKYELNIRNDKT